MKIYEMWENGKYLMDMEFFPDEIEAVKENWNIDLKEKED